MYIEPSNMPHSEIASLDWVMLGVTMGDQKWPPTPHSDHKIMNIECDSDT